MPVLTRYLSWTQVFEGLRRLHMSIEAYNPSLWGMPRGGTIVAGLLAAKYWSDTNLVTTPEEADFLVEDIYDTGATTAIVLDKYKKPILYLIHKPAQNIKEWVVFPWEVGEQVRAVKNPSMAHELQRHHRKIPHYHVDSGIPCNNFCGYDGRRVPLKRD